MYHAHDPTVPKKYGAIAHQEPQHSYHGGSEGGFEGPGKDYHKPEMYRSDSSKEFDSGYHKRDQEENKDKDKDKGPSLDDHLEDKKYEKHDVHEEHASSVSQDHPVVGKEQLHIEEEQEVHAPENPLKSVEDIVDQLSKPKKEVIHMDRVIRHH